jgi:hypothetical protein
MQATGVLLIENKVFGKLALGNTLEIHTSK